MPTAADFTARLLALASPERRETSLRFFKTGEGQYGAGDEFVGIGMPALNALCKTFMALPVPELEALLQSPVNEARAGACVIMNQLARRKKTPPETRRALYDLYLRNTHRINNWDLVDTAAPYVVGGYLFDKDRAVLHRLAESTSLWERRTAMLATLYFIKQHDLDETFRLAEKLLADREDLIHKAVGWMLREAGQVDGFRLRQFLDHHAPTMPRTALRYAIEKFTPEDRQHYLGVKRS